MPEDITTSPAFPSPEPKDEKQKCTVCGALVARTFMDLNGVRIHLCQQDSWTLLRMACKLEPQAMTNVHKFVVEQIYGQE